MRRHLFIGATAAVALTLASSNVLAAPSAAPSQASVAEELTDWMRRAAPLEAADAGRGFAAAATFCANDSHPDPIDYGKVADVIQYGVAVDCGADILSFIAITRDSWYTFELDGFFLAIDTDMNLSTGITEFAGADYVAGTIDGVSARLLRTPSSLAGSWIDAGPVYVGRPDLSSIGLGLPWSKVGSPTTFRYSGWLESVYTLPDYLPNTGAHIVTVSGGAPQAVPSAPPQPPAGPGYWMVGQDGRVFAFGGVRVYGEPVQPIADAAAFGVGAVDIDATRNGDGYWVLDNAGRVFAYGNARSFGNGDLGALAPGETFSSLSPTPSGNGYLLFTSRGRVVPFGDARTFGDMRLVPLNGPVVGSAMTPTGNGYWMIGSDGGVFSFGDAQFFGSMGGIPLNRPVNGIVPTPSNLGYWLVASDGGIFAFGDAVFRGSMGGTPLNRPVIGAVRFGNGYLMVASDGGIFNFSDQPFFGSLGANPPAKPIAAVAVFG